MAFKNDQRSGIERRANWCDGQCPHLGDVKAAHKDGLKEIKEDNEKEHDAMRKDIAAAARREDMKNIEDTARKRVPWGTFSLLILLAAGFGGWIANDHIGISRTVVGHDEILKHHTEYIREDREMKKVFYENQVALMHRFGVEPTPLPEQLRK